MPVSKNLVLGQDEGIEPKGDSELDPEMDVDQILSGIKESKEKVDIRKLFMREL